MSLAIGIDLGTTNSVAAYCDSDQFEVIANIEGGNLLPSYVYIEQDGNIVVGKEAKKMAVADPPNTIYQAKRLIGMTFEEAKTRRQKCKWPFDLVDENGVPKLRIWQKLYTPKQISGFVLAEIKRNAELQLDSPIKYAVITVPAYFNDKQRQATVEAGEKAGLTVLRIINEPTASVLAYSLQRRIGSSQNILIFDLGGGTFDISIVRVSRQSVSVIAVGGDTYLGGSDFDMNLVNYCLEQFRKKTGVTVPTDFSKMNENEKMRSLGKIERLRDQCEQCKIALSGLKSSSILNELFYDDHPLNEVITRDLFVSLNQHLFDKCMTIMNQVRIDSKFEWSQFDGILLVGGSTRIPAMKNKIRQHYQGKILENVDKDEVVARGAAVLAQILNPDKQSGEKVVDIADITPMSLGIETITGNMSIHIPKFAKIPATASKLWCAGVENQTSGCFSVYQGEDPVAVNNCFLDEFTVTGVPPTPKGQDMFEVSMDLDSNGILHVAANSLADKDRQNSIKIVRSSSQFR